MQAAFERELFASAIRWLPVRRPQAGRGWRFCYVTGWRTGRQPVCVLRFDTPSILRFFVSSTQAVARVSATAKAA